MKDHHHHPTVDPRIIIEQVILQGEEDKPTMALLLLEEDRRRPIHPNGVWTIVVRRHRHRGNRHHRHHNTIKTLVAVPHETFPRNNAWDNDLHKTVPLKDEEDLLPTIVPPTPGIHHHPVIFNRKIRYDLRHLPFNQIRGAAGPISRLLAGTPLLEEIVIRTHHKTIACPRRHRFNHHPTQEIHPVIQGMTIILPMLHHP